MGAWVEFGCGSIQRGVNYNAKESITDSGLQVENL